MKDRCGDGSCSEFPQAEGHNYGSPGKSPRWETPARRRRRSCDPPPPSGRSDRGSQSPAKRLTQDAALHLISKPLVTLLGKVVGILERRDARLRGLRPQIPKFSQHSGSNLPEVGDKMHSRKQFCCVLEEWMRRTGEAEIVHKVGQKELLRRDPRFRVYG